MIFKKSLKIITTGYYINMKLRVIKIFLLSYFEYHQFFG
jgi:hypothetical protein